MNPGKILEVAFLHSCKKIPFLKLIWKNGSNILTGCLIRVKNGGGIRDDNGIENTLAVAGVTILTSGMRDSFKIDDGMRDERQTIRSNHDYGHYCAFQQHADSKIQSLTDKCVFRYRQSNVRGLPYPPGPASSYCRALSRCLNCTQRFDYRSLGSSQKLEEAAEHLIDGSEKRICRLSFEFLESACY